MAALTGRALVAAMCLGQVGNLLPHVVVPAIMAQHLMPLWDLGAAQAGLMASAYAFGHGGGSSAHHTNRPRQRSSNIDGQLGLKRPRDRVVCLIADGLWSATLIWHLAGVGFAGAPTCRASARWKRGIIPPLHE